MTEHVKTEKNALEFIAIQNNLLEKVHDKTSCDAEIIIQRKIETYQNQNNADAAWQLVLENIQIENFR